MKRIFAIAFLFSLANLVQNMTGGSLDDVSLLSLHSLGNVQRLDASYGASELLVLSVLIHTAHTHCHLNGQQACSAA